MKKLIWCMALLLTGTGIVWVAGRTIRSGKLWTIQPIRAVPATARPTTAPWRVGPRDWAVLRDFERRMDSLKADAAGQGVYDSICRVRPGLQDSVRRILLYYFQPYFKPVDNANEKK